MGIMVERKEGTNQRTCMNDLWTWTMVWGLNLGMEGWAGWMRAKGENWDNFNRITTENPGFFSFFLFYHLQHVGISLHVCPLMAARWLQQCLLSPLHLAIDRGRKTSVSL